MRPTACYRIRISHGAISVWLLGIDGEQGYPPSRAARFAFVRQGAIHSPPFTSSTAPVTILV